MGIDNAPLTDDFTSLDKRVLNQLLNSNFTIDLLNSDLTHGYKSATESAAFSIKEGHKDTVWPPVPMAWVLTPADENGFQFWERSKTVPVCAEVPRPPDGATTLDPRAPNVIHVAHRLRPGSKWFVPGPDDSIGGDSEPVPATSDDGVTGEFQKYHYGFGNGIYLLVS